MSYHVPRKGRCRLHHQLYTVSPLGWKKTSEVLAQSYMDTLILTSLLVSMGISTFTSKEFDIFCRVSRIGNEKIMKKNGIITIIWVKQCHKPPLFGIGNGVFSAGEPLRRDRQEAWWKW